MTDMTGGFYNPACVNVGPGVAVTYLDPIITSNPTENCQNGSFSITVSGGYPAIFGGNFTASNLQPATASFVTSSVPNGGTIVINGLQNGDMYSFDIIDANGCPNPVTGGPFVGLPVANAGVDDTSCTLTYTLAAVPSYGTGTWSAAGVAFSNASSPTSNVTASAPGTYALTWTENNGGGCTASDVVNITFSSLSASSVSTSATCGNSDGSITITASNGISPYQYSVDGGITFQSSNTFNGLAANTYNIVVKDAALCQVTSSQVVPNSGVPVINSISTINPLCNGNCNGTITAVASGGGGGIQYSIDGVTFQSSGTFTNLCGATTYTITIKDVNSCTITKDTILVNPPLLVIDSIVSTNVSCNGLSDGTITIYASGGTGAISYSINNGTTFQTSNSFNALAINTYNIVVKDANACTANGTTSISQPAPLSIPRTLTNITCNSGSNGQIVVAPQGGTSPYHYTWSNGGNDAPIQSNLTAGNYMVTVTDTNGCFLDSTFTLTQPLALSYATASNNSFCNQPTGWAAVFGVSGGSGTYTYDWGSGPSSMDTLKNLIPGTYTVTVADVNNCDTTFSITVGNTPAFNASITSFTNATCNGATDGTATANGSDPFATYSFLWDVNAGNQTTQTATGLGAGSYLVTVKDINTLCTDTVSVVIGEPPLVTISVKDTTICYGQSAFISAQAAGGNGGPYMYDWDSGTFYGQYYNVSPLSTTSYNVVAYSLPYNCPSAPATVTVTVNPPLTVVASADVSICPGGSAVISAVGSFGNGGPYTYTWSNGVATASQTVTPPLSTTYIVALNDGCSPTVFDTVVVTVNPLPVPQFVADTFAVCETPPLPFTFFNLTDTTGGMVGSSIWTFGDGTSASGDTVSHTYLNPGIYNISLTVTSTAAAGACSDTLTKNNYVQVYADPTADFTMDPNPTTMFEPTVTFTDQSLINILTWNWNIGNLDTSNIQNPAYTFPEDTGTYIITLTVTDDHGCVNAKSDIVVVRGEYGLYVPNAFTPDNDGLNEGFFPNGFGISEDNYSFMIFDRWGELIFESHTKFEPWNGKYKGSIVQLGVYVWKIKFKDINGIAHTKIGRVTIVR